MESRVRSTTCKLCGTGSTACPTPRIQRCRTVVSRPTSRSTEWLPSGGAAQRHEETARLLDETKEALARRFTVLQRRLSGDEYREYGQYVRFRNLMAKAISDLRLQSLEWLRDYWLFHPFVPDRDIERGNRARPDPAFVWSLNHQQRKSKPQFRLEMARRLRPGPDYHRMVQEYWRTHPIDANGDDEATRREYARNTR